MNKLTVLYLVISVGLLAGTAVADETYICTHGTQERILTIVYQDQEAKIPCEVQYEKDGVIETLWTAQNVVGYCEEKAQSFLEKQRGWGWSCEAAGEGMAEEGMMQKEPMKEEMQKDAKESSY